MPITLAPNKLFAKKEDGSGYLPANVVTGQTTEEQCALIEAKGAQTRASIPDDYTALSDSVVDLKSAFTRFEHPSDNIVAELVYTQGAYYNNIGEYKTDGNWGYTDLIPAEPGKIYFINTPVGQYICFYDASSEFISGFSAVQATAPANTAYIRVSIIKSRQSVARLTIGSPYYSYVDELKNAFGRNQHPADNIVTDLVYNQGGYYNNAGNLTIDENWGYTDLIPIVAGKTYYLNTTVNQYICFYNASNAFISGVAATNATAPSTAAYIRISISKARQAGVKLTVDNVYTDYVDQLESRANTEADVRDRVLDGIISYDGFQYADTTAFKTGYIWDVSSGEPTETENANYSCGAILSLPAGTYYAQGYARWQSYVKNLLTGAFSDFNTMGWTGGANSVTIDYPFDVYISAQNSNLPNVLFYSGSGFIAGMSNYYGVRNPNIQQVFHCGANRAITRLTDAIKIAERYMDSILYVDAGEYDLIAEFGDSYFTNFTGDGSYLDGAWGIVLKNRIHIIFAENAKVVCHYTGNNQAVGTYFSAFNAGRYGFTLENANIDTSGIRYAIHDDRGNADEEGYSNKYIRCRVKHNKIGTQISGMDQAIGGGFGNNGDILIDGCWFEAVGYTQPVTYHNSANGGMGYKAHCTIKDSYFVGGLRFNDTGASTEITDIYVCGNSFSRGIDHGKTTPDAADNVVVYAWNNTIRN